MELMPRPIRTAPGARFRMLSELRVAVYKAKPETTIAMNIDSSVVSTSYAMGIGRLNASMPMKCMDQMPMPMAKAPPSSQEAAAAPVEAAMREGGARRVRAGGIA